MLSFCGKNWILNIMQITFIIRGFFIQRNIPQWGRVSSFTGFLGHTQRRTTVCRTALDEWSARRRYFYLTTHNTHNKHSSPSWIRTHNFSRRADAGLRLKSRDRWDGVRGFKIQKSIYIYIYIYIGGVLKNYTDWNYSGCSLGGMCLQPVFACSYMS